MTPTPALKACPFDIGDEVAVIPDCDDWAGDWRDVRLWIAAIHALPGGGFDFWVSDAWPLPDNAALTDGFYMGRDAEPDTLSLVARNTREALSAVPQEDQVERAWGPHMDYAGEPMRPGEFRDPPEDQVERVARAIFDSHNATYTIGGLLVWESDPEHWRRYARAALRSSGIDGGE